MEAGAERLILTFPRGDGERATAITLHMRPTRSGSLSGRVGLIDGPSVQFEQLVYPTAARALPEQGDRNGLRAARHRHLRCGLAADPVQRSRRTLAELTTFDFVLLLIIAEATQQALLGEDSR